MQLYRFSSIFIFWGSFLTHSFSFLFSPKACSQCSSGTRRWLYPQCTASSMRRAADFLLTQILQHIYDIPVNEQRQQTTTTTFQTTTTSFQTPMTSFEMPTKTAMTSFETPRTTAMTSFETPMTSFETPMDADVDDAFLQQHPPEKNKDCEACIEGKCWRPGTSHAITTDVQSIRMDFGGVRGPGRARGVGVSWYLVEGNHVDDRRRRLCSAQTSVSTPRILLTGLFVCLV